MPIHPSLIHFPIALLTVGAIASVLFRFLRNRSGERWGVYSLLTGWALTLPALISGIIDKNKIVPNSIAEPVADLHTSLMVSMWIIFGVALYLYYIWRKKRCWSARNYGFGSVYFYSGWSSWQLPDIKEPGWFTNMASAASHDTHQ